MNKQRLAVAIFTALGVIATFLPWHKLLWFNYNGFQVHWEGWPGFGWISFTLYVVALAMSVTGDRSSRILKGRAVGVWICALAASTTGIWRIVSIHTEHWPEDVSPGIGIFLTAVAGIAAVVCLVTLKGKQAGEPPHQPIYRSGL